ncbi:MAG: FkbM family methyltransferase [Patescibacteria group bacterium]|nr:FkbM family methyltransferase [Patescibacteria group bacterium]
MNKLLDFKTIKLSKLKISVQNIEEAKRIYHDIFKGKEYFFETNKKSPLILDCGAHVGLSVLYFKTLYPDARIIAFEPNTNSFQLLKLNVQQNDLSKVKLVNAALSNEEGTAQLHVSNETNSPWTWGDAIVKNPWQSPETTKTVKVGIVKLSKYIIQNVDLIKLDVEGSEAIVLEEIKGKLSLVDRIVMEFHGNRINKDNNLEKIVKLLEDNSFIYKIKQEGELIDLNKVKKDESYWLIIWAKKKTS